MEVNSCIFVVCSLLFLFISNPSEYLATVCISLYGQKAENFISSRIFVFVVWLWIYKLTENLELFFTLLFAPPEILPFSLHTSAVANIYL